MKQNMNTYYAGQFFLSYSSNSMLRDENYFVAGYHAGEFN